MLQDTLREETQRRRGGKGLAGATWQPAQHNLPFTDDRRWSVTALANKAVDAAAGRSAEGGRDRELLYFASHDRPRTGTPYLSSAGAPISSDVRAHAVSSVGWRTAARASQGETCGVTIRLARQGRLCVKATALAHKKMGAYAMSTKLRAMLGRSRGTVSELLRHGNMEETACLRKILQIHGGEDRRCTCGEGAEETRRHLRLECSHTRDAAEMVERIASERLAALGCSFYFDVGARVGYWNQGEHIIRREIAKAGSPDDGWELRPKDELIELWPGNTKTARTAAVGTRERLGCLSSWWTGRPGRPHRPRSARAVDAMLRSTRGRTRRPDP